MSRPARGLFVTGTDTGVGKTWASVALLRALRTLGLKAVGMKPVASGCRWQDGRLVNEDALMLQAHSALPLDYSLVNPYAFEPAVSPHIAADLAGVSIDLGMITAAYERLAAMADVVVVEGVGGWLAPLNSRQTVEDLARCLDLPVVLVVGLRLGCLSHAQLTERAIRGAKSDCLGWIGNQSEAVMVHEKENITSLGQHLNSPCLGVFPFGERGLDRGWIDSVEPVLTAALHRSRWLQSTYA